jgi:hypothetical protein
MLYTENNEILRAENSEVFRIDDSILNTYQLALQKGMTVKYWAEGRYHNGRNVALNANNTVVSPVNLGVMTPVNTGLRYFTKNEIRLSSSTENIKGDGTSLRNVNKFLYTIRCKITAVSSNSALVRILTNNSGSANSRLRIYVQNSTTIEVFIQRVDASSNDNSSIILQKSVIDGNYHTFQVYVDYSNNIKKTFVDGVLVENKTIVLGTGNTSNTNSGTNRDAVFGGNPTAQSGFCHLSLLVDGTSLTDLDIQKMYNYSRITELES